MHSNQDSRRDLGSAQVLGLGSDVRLSRPVHSSSKVCNPVCLTDQKTTSSVLQLVDQIKAQTKEPSSLGKQDTRGIFGPEPALSHHFSHVEARLDQQLTPSRDGLIPVARRFSQTLPQEGVDMKIECPPKLGLFDEDKCLKMILNPEFVEALQVLKQASGSTIEASTQSETCMHEIRKFDMSKVAKERALEDQGTEDMLMEPELAENLTVKEETKFQDLAASKTNLKTRK